MQFTCIKGFAVYDSHIMNVEANPPMRSTGLFNRAEAYFNPDRVGVFASILCAIHCAVTPIILLLLPAFGKIWAHPASHWGMAIFVVPIAAIMMTKGYQRHGRRWVLAIGSAGILLVLAGAATPYFENSSILSSSTAESETCTLEQTNEPIDSETQTKESCHQSCCPSLVAQEGGGFQLHFPLASIITTIGGLLLIATHIGNLCRCSCCKKPE